MAVFQKFLLIVAAVGFSFFAKAANSSTNEQACQKLLNEIRAMESAQKILLSNMVQSNKAMASTLEGYSAQMKVAAKARRPVSSQDVTGLKLSAQTFRAHGARESRLVEQFNQATAALLRRVEICLK